MRSAGGALTTEERGVPDPGLWNGNGERAGTRLGGLTVREAPLLWAAGMFAAGEVLERGRWHPAVVLLVAVGLLGVLSWVALRRSRLRKKVGVAWLPVAAVWVVVGWWCAEVRPVAPTQGVLAGYADGLSRRVQGRVVRVRMLPPRVAAKTDEDRNDKDKDATWWEEPEGAGLMVVDLAVEQVEEVTPDVAWMRRVEGGVRVVVVPDKLGAPVVMPELRCGERVEVPLQMKVPERYRDPGAWQYADYLLEQGIGFRATAKVGRVQRLGSAAGDMRCRLFAAQTWAAGRMERFAKSGASRTLPTSLRLNADDVGMLNAMLFGDRAGLNHALRLGFERTGSFHLFVVSGMHVALLAGGLFWLMRRLRVREWLATLVTLSVTLGYALLTGFGAPVQRALWMTAIFLCARLLSRERRVLNALGAAALGVLVWSPGALFEASFQMTFLVIVAIGGIAVPLGERSLLRYARAAERLEDEWVDVTLVPRVAQLRVMLRLWGEAVAGVVGKWAYGVPALGVRAGMWVGELMLIGVVAEVVMVLPMAVYFHRATVFALPANMVSVPLVGVLAPLAVVTFCASLVSAWLAVIPGALTALLLHGVAGLIGRVSAVRAAEVRVPGPAGWVALAVFAGFCFCCWAVRRSRGWAWLAVGLLPLLAGAVLWPERVLVTADAMEVTALDVGQGDSIFVAGPTGSTLLIDAGGPVGSVKETAEATSRFDVGEEVVSPYLWERRVRRLDAVALTHAHSDHMGGMAAVLRNMRPRELWVGVDADSEAYRALLAEAAELGVVVRHLRAGEDFDWGGMRVKVLAPEVGYGHMGAPVNDDSLVLRVEYGRAAVLLEGDAQAASEATMLRNGRVEPVTLLKVGHHGSRTSTTAEFYAAAAPKDAVVSVGRANTFGHPRGEVIARIAEGGTRLYRTDEFGVVRFLLTRDGAVRTVGSW